MGESESKEDVCNKAAGATAPQLARSSRLFCSLDAVLLTKDAFVKAISAAQDKQYKTKVGRKRRRSPLFWEQCLLQSSV